jgi:hypothetical protein
VQQLMFACRTVGRMGVQVASAAEDAAVVAPKRGIHYGVRAVPSLSAPPLRRQFTRRLSSSTSNQDDLVSHPGKEELVTINQPSQVPASPFTKQSLYEAVPLRSSPFTKQSPALGIDHLQHAGDRVNYRNKLILTATHTGDTCMAPSKILRLD